VDTASVLFGVVQRSDRWTMLARLLWCAAAIATLLQLAVGAPRLFVDLQTVCIADCSEPDWQAAPMGLAALSTSGISLQGYAEMVVALLISSAALWIVPAVLLAWHSRNRHLALFGAFFLLTVGAELSGALLEAAAVQQPFLSPLGTAIRLLGDVALGVFLFIFPDGHFAPSWTKWLVIAWIVSQVPTELAPGTWLDSNTWPPAVLIITVPGYFVIGLGAQVWRYRHRSTPVERQQTKWALYGFVVGLGAQNLLLGYVTLWLREAVAIGSPAFLLAMTATRVFLLLIPLSMVVAILRYRLWDVDILINRTLVYVALIASVTGLYLIVVGYLSVLFRSGQNPWLSLAAAALVALLFQPLRLWLQRLVNRLLYGQRDEPYAVLARLGRRLENTAAPEAALVSIVQTLREALKVPYSAVVLDDRGDRYVAAAAGEPPVGQVERWSLTYQQESVGELLIAPRAPGEHFNPSDRRLLQDLARQAGTAANAVRLTADLRRARERLVTAREEERRRLRRDLHDGLGPQLASQALTIDAARSLMERDPQAADRLLVDLKLQSQAAVADVRRLVDGLRPPALDDLGLVGALHAAALNLAQAGLDVEIAAGPLPPLPAAVEVAAFRIVQEAITNVLRHANAKHAWVSLEPTSCARTELSIEVRDDGTGFEESACSDAGNGVGLMSMRERADELGGRVVLESTPGGTTVRAWLPLSEPS
jgi:signal transduction histidine kinase